MKGSLHISRCLFVVLKSYLCTDLQALKNKQIIISNFRHLADRRSHQYLKTEIILLYVLHYFASVTQQASGFQKSPLVLITESERNIKNTESSQHGAKLSSDSEWWGGMRHRSETSLAGHLHRANKGNPALHHHDSWYKPVHPTSQNVAELGVTSKRPFSPTVNQACIWLTTNKS